MKARIVIDFTDDRASELAALTRGVDLNTLLRDALGEFCRTREPVEEYVAKRYASSTQGGVHNDRFRASKVREVHKRLQLADVLRLGAVTIEVDASDAHGVNCATHDGDRCNCEVSHGR